MKILTVPMGFFIRLIYDAVLFLENDYISAYALAIIISTLIFRLVLYPLTAKQTKSMKAIQDINPKIEELQRKYGKDPQTFQRKQVELYKEYNINPMAGCLPLLIQLPILMAYFYVIRDPQYAFSDFGHYITQVIDGNSVQVWEWTTEISRNFIWLKDLSYAANAVFADGTVNGFSIGIPLPFIGNAIPILAIISAVTTYLTTAMMKKAQTSTMNEQQMSTQNTMNVMMPIMIFIMSISFPSGLVLYWVVSNIFQLVQQYIIMHGKSKNTIKEDLK